MERPHPGPLPVGEGGRCLDEWFDLGWGAYAGLGSARELVSNDSHRPEPEILRGAARVDK